MTKQEYEAEIDAIRRSISSLQDGIAQLAAKIARGEIEDEKPTPPHPRWMPEDCDKFYVINYCDLKKAVCYDFNSDISDINRFKIGLAYKTPDEAAFAVERLRILAEMREWAGKWNDDYAIVLDKDSIKYFIAIKFFRGCVLSGGLRFATEGDAENCIKAVGEDRIKKYYFMIPEDEKQA